MCSSPPQRLLLLAADKEDEGLRLKGHDLSEALASGHSRGFVTLSMFELSCARMFVVDVAWSLFCSEILSELRSTVGACSEKALYPPPPPKCNHPPHRGDPNQCEPPCAAAVEMYPHIPSTAHVTWPRARRDKDYKQVAITSPWTITPAKSM